MSCPSYRRAVYRLELPYLLISILKSLERAAQDLAGRYGKPIIVLNLVKGAEKRPRESILQAELANAVAYINKGVRPPVHVAKTQLSQLSTPKCKSFWCNLTA